MGAREAILCSGVRNAETTIDQHLGAAFQLHEASCHERSQRLRQLQLLEDLDTRAASKPSDVVVQVHATALPVVVSRT